VSRALSLSARFMRTSATPAWVETLTRSDIGPSRLAGLEGGFYRAGSAAAEAGTSHVTEAGGGAKLSGWEPLRVRGGVSARPRPWS
jgi:hypothetical protein